MSHEQKLSEAAAQLVSRARRGEQIEAYVEHGHRTEITMVNGHTEDVVVATTQRLHVRVINDERMGYATASTFDEAVMRSTLAAARHNAEVSERDPAVALAEMNQAPSAEMITHRGGLANLSMEQKLSTARELDRVARSLDPRVKTVDASVWADEFSIDALATTTGLSRTRTLASCTASVRVLATAPDGSVSCAVGSHTVRDPAHLDLALTASDAVLRASRSLGGQRPASGRTKVVCHPAVTSALLGVLGNALLGDRICAAGSVFSGRQGEVVGAASVHLTDDATNDQAPGAAPHDDEGTTTRPVSVIDAGRLVDGLHDVTSGRRCGQPSTGSAVRSDQSPPKAAARALALQPGDDAPEQLISTIADGVYLLAIRGLNSGVDLVSGEVSVGALGLRIRHGELAEPLSEFGVSFTLSQLLNNLAAVASDQIWFGATAGSTVRVDDVYIAGS